MRRPDHPTKGLTAETRGKAQRRLSIEQEFEPRLQLSASNGFEPRLQPPISKQRVRNERFRTANPVTRQRAAGSNRASTCQRAAGSNRAPPCQRAAGSHRASTCQRAAGSNIASTCQPAAGSSRASTCQRAAGSSRASSHPPEPGPTCRAVLFAAVPVGTSPSLQPLRAAFTTVRRRKGAPRTPLSHGPRLGHVRPGEQCLSVR